MIMDVVKAIAAGAMNCMAIKKDGTLWTWGSIDIGEQDDTGEVVSREIITTPEKTMEDVKAISAGSLYCMAIKTNGSLWTWGYNRYGQLGNGERGNEEFNNTPENVMKSVSAFAAGVTHSMAVKKDKSLWTCSDNDFGQLGLATDNRIPSQVKK